MHVFLRFAGYLASVLARDSASGMECSVQVRTACRAGPHAVQTPCRWSEDRLPGDLGCSPGNRKERHEGRTRLGPWLGPRLGPWLGPRLVTAAEVEGPAGARAPATGAA